MTPTVLRRLPHKELPVGLSRMQVIDELETPGDAIDKSTSIRMQKVLPDVPRRAQGRKNMALQHIVRLSPVHGRRREVVAWSGRQSSLARSRMSDLAPITVAGAGEGNSFSVCAAAAASVGRRLHTCH